MLINPLKKYNNGGMIIALNKSNIFGLLAIIFLFDSKIQNNTKDKVPDVIRTKQASIPKILFIFIHSIHVIND